MGRLGWSVGLMMLLGGGGALSWALAPRLPAKPDIPGLQALATESCRCARGKPDEGAKRACWAEFESRAASYKLGEFKTYCEPVSPSGYCFGTSGDDCVVKEYSASPETASLCSAEEARIAEGAFNDAGERAPNDPAAAFKAFLDAARAIGRGEKVAAAPRDGGCAG
ncbi:MAG TPA: hypothetical protein VF652_08710 [Allosphingosinicella sp.]